MPGQGPEQGPEQGNERLAVVLFNLGGPNSLKTVTPFLFNLFNDPAIIGAPGALRWALAWVLSLWRTPVAKAIYDEIGGGSPIVPLTQQQARALETRLLERSGWAEVGAQFIAPRAR